MKKLTLPLSLAVSIPAFAQTEGTAIFLKGGYMYAPGAENAFTRISSNGIKGFTNHFSLQGAEGIYRTDKAVLGFEISVGTQKAKTKEIHSLKPYIGAGHLRAGYILFERNEWWMYPSLGAGVSVHNLSVRETLTEDKVSKIDNLTSYSPSIDFGFNGELLTTKENGNQKNVGGLILGFRVGYRLSFGNTEWKNNDGATVLKNYSYKNDIFYAALIAGLGMFKVEP